MQTVATRLSGLILLAPDVHGDERGFFVETFREAVLSEMGIAHGFVQDNQSRSRHGIVRGMHYQSGQAKLVRCARGAILDVVVDIRRGSRQFGEWEAVTLDDVAHRQLYVPEGFAHGFCVLSELADVTYKVSTYYDPAAESGFAYDDPAVGIEWPEVGERLVSARDREAPTLAEIEASIPFRYAGD
ncbi:MAG TPA: dTDP-4-dehydrorhamnose 3,5-epimerase [Solirubrobacteraceae bacterium]|jgi:dTDP-4-dehydrorhamnose 3,5-epimerase|nr:dTDP-4-dehydrorhamnose 3,5-epimerase [Solirubrobacteraceae bacterium]